MEILLVLVMQISWIYFCVLSYCVKNPTSQIKNRCVSSVHQYETDNLTFNAR